MAGKISLVIGASENTERYSNKAIHLLLEKQHPVYAIGLKPGIVAGVEIKTGFPIFKDVDTVTLYINPIVQQKYYSYIINLNPQRIIFNPGTENQEFIKLATQHHIQCLEACTLVLLTTYQY